MSQNENGIEQVSIQIFQLYRDNLEDLLVGNGKDIKRGSDPLTIMLAEHSPTGLVQVLDVSKYIIHFFNIISYIYKKIENDCVDFGGRI